MGYDSPFRGRGRGSRGGSRDGGSESKSVSELSGGSLRGHKPSGSSRGGSFRGGQGFDKQKNGTMSPNFRGGRNFVSPRGARGTFSPRGGSQRGMDTRGGRDQQNFTPRGGRGQQNFTPRGGRGQQNFTPRDGRGQQSFTPRGGRGQQNFTPRGGRSVSSHDSFKNKRKSFDNVDVDSNAIKNAKKGRLVSASSTPDSTKASKKKRFDRDSDNEDEKEEALSVVHGKKKTDKKIVQVKPQDDSDDDDEEWDEEEEEDEDEDSEADVGVKANAPNKSDVPAKKDGVSKQGVCVKSDDDDESGESDSYEDEEEDEVNEKNPAMKARTGKDSTKPSASKKPSVVPMKKRVVSKQISAAVESDESDVDDEDEDDEEISDDDEEENELSEVQKIPSKVATKQSALKKSTVAPAKKNVTSGQTPVTESTDDDDEEDDEEGSDEDEEEGEDSEVDKVALNPVRGTVAKNAVGLKKATASPTKKDATFHQNDAAIGSDIDDEDEEDDEGSEEDHEEGNGNEKKVVSKPTPVKGVVQKVATASKQSITDEDEEDEEEDEDSDDEDEEESLEDEDQVEPVVSTPKVEQIDVKSALKSGKSTSKKSVTVSAAPTPLSSAKKLPVTPHPSKKVAAERQVPKTKLNFDDDSSDENEEELDEEEEYEEHMDITNGRKGDNEKGQISEEDEEEEEDEDDDDEEDSVVRPASAKLAATKAQSRNVIENKAPSEKIESTKPTNVNEQTSKGVKRKTESDERVAKHMKLDESAILEEESKRRQERDERSLFIKGFPKKTKMKELEELHADIETVRYRNGSSFAWLVFRSEASCIKAHAALSKTKLGGRELTVDFCGLKSSRQSSQEIRDPLPVNPLELYINGLPPKITKDDIRNVFRAATSINFPASRHGELRRAFVLFSTEEDAKAAFEKGKLLKFNGKSVDVFYARIRKNALASATVKPVKAAAAGTASSTAIRSIDNTAPKKKALVSEVVKAVDSSESSGDDEVESSGEGIEEVVEKSAKSVNEQRKTELTSNGEEDDEDDEDEEEEEGDDSEEDEDEEIEESDN